MIPDKIYIRHYWMPGELDDDWHLKPSPDDKNEEYIRKDALLEWAQMQKKGWSEIGQRGAEVVLDALIEKLTSL